MFDSCYNTLSIYLIVIVEWNPLLEGNHDMGIVVESGDSSEQHFRAIYRHLSGASPEGTTRMQTVEMALICNYHAAHGLFWFLKS